MIMEAPRCMFHKTIQIINRAQHKSQDLQKKTGINSVSVTKLAENECVRI